MKEEENYKRRMARTLRRVQGMSIAQLQDAYYEELGVATRARNKAWLVKRVFFAMQSRIEGLSLSPEAQDLIDTLAKDHPVRVRPVVARKLPETKEAPTRKRDARLPEPGTVLTRTYKRQRYVVEVLDHGFLYDGQHYKGLSGVAKVITGKSWNGFVFFGLDGSKEVA